MYTNHILELLRHHSFIFVQNFIKMELAQNSSPPLCFFLVVILWQLIFFDGTVNKASVIVSVIEYIV